MGLVERVTDSGLILREREDGLAVARALREYDRDLSLVVDSHGLWRVYAGDVFVCDWSDADGSPLPLTMGLLDKIKLLDKNTSSKAPDPDELNARQQAATQAQKARDLEAIEAEFLPILETNRLSVRIPREV
jgi:hypothetical protein